jgi:hypothetical protein
MDEFALAKATRIAAGQEVPPWLLVLEPLGIQSTAGKILADVHFDVVETEDAYWVWPLSTGTIEALMHIEGGLHCKVVAGGKQVRLSTASMLFTGDVYALAGVPRILGAPAVPPAALRPEPGEQGDGLGFFRGLLWSSVITALVVIGAATVAVAVKLWGL